MTAIITPQQIPINQYQAGLGETTFNYSFLVLQANSATSDLLVYVTPSGQDANPTADLVPYTDFTVTGVGNVTGGTVVFNVAVSQGAIVTLVRSMQISITTQFNDAQQLNGLNLDDAFRRVVLIMQQISADLQQKALQYFINVLLPTATSNQLPVLTESDNQVWVSQGGEIIAAVIENDVNISLLRSQLANESQGGNGASLIGYYDEYHSVPLVLDDFLNALPAYIIEVMGGAGAVFATGDLKPSFNALALSGWIIWDDGTIGNAASNATNLADASTEDLFTVLWDGFSNTACPIFDSAGMATTRGVSAAADYAADKAIQLPDGNGRAIANQAGGTYTAGIGFGADSVTLSEANLAAHDHGGSFANMKTRKANVGTQFDVYIPIAGTGTNAPLTLDMVSDGTATAVDVRQTTMPVYWNVKL